MTDVYFYLVLFNAAVSLMVAGVVFWKNRYEPVGPLLGGTMFITAVWLVGFAQYFRPLDTERAMWWAKLTLSCSLMVNPLFFHAMVALVNQLRRYRMWNAAAYACGFVLVALVWQGHIIQGMKFPPFMSHYAEYNRSWYPLLGLHIMAWQIFGAGVMAYNAWRSVGYKRTQLIYFISGWLIVSLTTNSILLPLEYNVNIQPFGFFLLPLNLAFLAYVMAKARLADYNVVIARILMYAITLVVVALVSLLFVGGMALIAPGFMNQEQLTFSVMLASAMGFGLTIVLPRLLPRAERIMQERLFGSRAGYQEALAGLLRQLGGIPNIDALLGTVASTVHSQMQLTRVLLLMEDPLSGRFRLRAESGLNAEEAAVIGLETGSSLLKWLQDNKRVFVRDEIARQVPDAVLRELAVDLDRLGVAVCVPTVVDERLTGLVALGPKTNNEMFYISDLNLLSNLGTELALVLKYRRVEEEIFHKNKLIELGTIAAGVAHEIRNPVASIRTFAQLLPEKIGDPEFTNEFSKLVLKDVDRINKVIENMLAFARPAQVVAAPHGAVDLVEDSILLSTPKLKSKNIRLTKEYHEKPVVNVDKPKIQQVLINLISNAVDALPEQGQIHVATGVRWMEDTGNGNQSRRFAVIEVADNGPGIPAGVRNRLFDPFFTTKKDGTGLGLSISQKIVRDHGGIITVSSIEGKGTRFQVNLPVD